MSERKRKLDIDGSGSEARKSRYSSNRYLIVNKSTGLGHSVLVDGPSFYKYSTDGRLLESRLGLGVILLLFSDSRCLTKSQNRIAIDIAYSAD